MVLSTAADKRQRLTFINTSTCGRVGTVYLYRSSIPSFQKQMVMVSFSKEPVKLSQLLLQVKLFYNNRNQSPTGMCLMQQSQIQQSAHSQGRLHELLFIHTFQGIPGSTT